jgi:hypothetical protein
MWIVSHGFGERPKAMSKTARRCIARHGRQRQQRLAILPWLCDLAGQMGDGSPRTSAALLPD